MSNQPDSLYRIFFFAIRNSSPLAPEEARGLLRQLMAVIHLAVRMPVRKVATPLITLLRCLSPLVEIL